MSTRLLISCCLGLRALRLATVRYPVLEVEAKVETFENGRCFTLRVLRAGKPRKR